VDTPSVNPGSFVTANDAIAMGGNPNLCFLPANLNVQQCYNQRIVAGHYTNLGTGPNFSDLKTKASSLTAEWNLTDAMTLKSITAWRALDGAFAQDRDGGPQLDLDSSVTPQLFNPLNQVQDSFEQRQLSQELQLQGKAPTLDWLLGLYYFREYGSNFNPVDFTVVSIQSGGSFHYNSKAAFAQATWQATDALAITPGARYTKDERAYLPDQYFQELPVGPLGFPCFVPTVHVPCAVGDRVVPYASVLSSASKFTPYLNAAYKWTPDLLTYLTYSQGFKSGGYTQRIFPPEASLPSFAPESVKSYEAGFKLTALGGGMRFNGAAFYTDYTDLQLLVSDPTRVGPFITNAGKAAIDGLELEWAFAPGAGWQLNAGAGYTHPKYKELANGVDPAQINLHSDFVLISKWNANASVEKLFRLAGGAVLAPRVDYSWRSRFATNSSGVPQPTLLPQGFLYQPSYGVLNAGLRWSSPSDQFSFMVGGTNLTDEHYRTFGDYQPSFGFTMEAFDRGRQWYAKAAAKF
jgi:iron complex outermembrane receptor protein